jgi:hypothetical protein
MFLRGTFFMLFLYLRVIPGQHEGRHDSKHNDIQHNAIRHNDNQHKGLIYEARITLELA